METFESAVARLQELLHDDVDEGTWRWRLRQELSTVREALESERFRSFDGWLTARSKSSERDRARLVSRIAALGPAVLDRLDPEAVRMEVSRLLADVEHYHQRVHDLIYDSVALEIGGSE